MGNINIQKLKKVALLSFLILCFTGVSGQVGVETDDPNTALDVNGTISLKAGQQLIFTEGNNNNINLGTNPYSFYTITGPTTSFNITGIIPLNGVDGQIVTLQNNTADTNMNVIHNSSASVMENRIQLPNGKNFRIKGKYSSITLQYNATNKSWTLVNSLNNVQTWYIDGLVKLIDGRKTTLTINAPFVTPTTGVSTNMINVTGLTDTKKFNIVVEYVEVLDEKVLVRFNNKNPQTGSPCSRWNESGCTFIEIGLGLTFNVN